MRLSWQTRLIQQPGLRAFSRWPVIPRDTVPRARRAAFLRNQQIVAQVLGGASLQAVAHQHDLSPGRISQLLNRCLGGEADAPPALTAGLIPHRVVVTKQRQRPLPRLAKPGGASCAFQALLDAVPSLRTKLDTMIKANLDEQNTAQRLTPLGFYGEFERLLTEAHWPRDQYPYTTSDLANESVRRYLHQRTAVLQQQELLDHQSPPKDQGIRPPRYRALRAIQIDEHLLHLRSRVELQLNDELIPLPIGRASVLVAVDVDTHCILGYLLVPTEAPNQQDLLTLLDQCLQPWQPLTLRTPGLRYTPGASFPSGLSADFPVSFGTVQMDNAWMHWAGSVVDLLCEQCGATLNLGIAGIPEIRALVESLFDYINRHFSHRVASTTGSYPTDPKKESRKNQQRPPVITFQTVNEALSVILTDYNLRPQAALGGAAPLELFQHHCANHYVRYVPELLRRQWQPFLGSGVRPLRWYRHEHRQPHVNFYYERYHGPGLLRVAGRETSIRVQFDRRDLRTLQAFTLAGEDLGVLQVATPWQRFPHSLALRQTIHKAVKRHRLSARDPLADYFRRLLEQKDKPAMALSLLRVYTEFTAGLSQPLILGADSDLDHPSSRASQTPPRYRWDPDGANHRD